MRPWHRAPGLILSALLLAACQQTGDQSEKKSADTDAKEEDVSTIPVEVATPTRGDVAMTGEITLRGRVLGGGGVKEKAVAALRGGMRSVILPASNASDIELLPSEVLDQLRFVMVRSMDEVMEAALAYSPLRSRPRSPAGPELGVPLSHG